MRQEKAGLGGSAWPWLLPALAMLAVFYLVPVLDVVRLAFTDATLLRGASRVTTETLFDTWSDERLPLILRNTGVFVVAAVAGLTLTGLGVALLLVRAERRGLWLAGPLRVIVLTAWILPGVANGILWQMLLSEAPFGAVNSALALAGIAPVRWLSDPQVAMVSVLIATLWQGTAFSMIVLYAARARIDVTLYEAAEVDGAGPLMRFIHITLPQMRAALTVNAILLTIQTLNGFDAIIALTGGGPGQATEVLSLHIYNRVFVAFDLAGGAALALLLLSVALVLTLLWLRLLRREAA
jgi:multiple sugar transport system permease protein